ALGAAWRDGYAGMIVDLARLPPPTRQPRETEATGALGAAAPEEEGGAEGGPASGARRDAGSEPPLLASVDPRRQRLIRFLEKQTGVFGVVLNGEARAYPKRILAWHELALDRVGGVELAVVYCTLCGTVIPYGAEPGGRKFTFGTSGLLYRSNKLMF